MERLRYSLLHESGGYRVMAKVLTLVLVPTAGMGAVTMELALCCYNAWVRLRSSR